MGLQVHGRELCLATRGLGFIPSTAHTPKAPKPPRYKQASDLPDLLITYPLPPLFSFPFLICYFLLNEVFLMFYILLAFIHLLKNFFLGGGGFETGSHYCRLTVLNYVYQAGLCLCVYYPWLPLTL